MRKLKFRGWDKIRNKWVTDFLIDPNYGTAHTTNGNLLYNGVHETELLLSEYTGLCDKKGNEICEGDILSVEKGNKNMALWEVVHDFNGFYLKRYATHGVPDPGVFGMRNDLEVIGNIYENHELL